MCEHDTYYVFAIMKAADNNDCLLPEYLIEGEILADLLLSYSDAIYLPGR